MNEDCGTAIIGSPYAWLRLTISLLLSTIAGIGMWSTVVALPAVQADFGIDRATASLPFTLAFGGYAFGGVLMGRLADRVGIVTPLTIGALMVGLGGQAGCPPQQVLDAQRSLLVCGPRERTLRR